MVLWVDLCHHLCHPPSSDEALTSSTSECVLIWKYVHVCVCVCLPTHMCTLCHFSSVWLFATLWMVAHQTFLSMGFFRQEYWHGLPCPSPGGLPVLGIEPMSPTAHALQADSFGLSHQGSPKLDIRPLHKLSVDLGCGLTGVEGTSNPVWRVSLWRGN